MVEKAKITLSDKEQELVINTDWILTKYLIIQKVCDLFGNLLPSMQSVISTNKESLPANINITYPKISKGEHYLQLPYVMLDYPRCFKKNNILAIRTFFWWGNFFSISLHLSGSHKTKATPVLIKNFEKLGKAGYSVCIAKDEWMHHFKNDNYVPLKNYTRQAFEKILAEKEFVKIARNITLQNWNKAPLFLEQSFNELILLLRN
ncbi:MAG: hypothetical protein HY305_00550 [Sphingobacteriales bacterium]|nr:hypothetical protein [Sphingobacteriales bacterium]